MTNKLKTRQSDQEFAKQYLGSFLRLPKKEQAKGMLTLLRATELLPTLKKMARDNAKQLSGK